MRYKQVYDGEWVTPKMSLWLMKCCKCGLVHRMKFKVKHHGRGHKVMFRATRVR